MATSLSRSTGRRSPSVGLQVALGLGKALGKRVEAVAVYDPYLHYSVFNGIVDVLSEKASKVFRFKEQEALHEEIIDSGLAQIYESHLRVAQAQAAEAGVDLPITLLDGKAFQRVARYAAEREAWLLVCGRVGVHSPPEMDLGSNTDHLIATPACNVLVCNRTHVPPIDVRAETSVVWTPGSGGHDGRRARAAARGLARTAVLRWCTERGHSVVSSGDVELALDDLMPYRRTMRRIEEVSSALDAATAAMLDEAPPESARAICRVCGYAARTDAPARCPVCGGDAGGFDQIDAEAVARAGEREGEMASDTFDGHKLGWTLEARTLLQQLPAGYLRRRVKAIVEKTARTRRLPAITAEVAAPFVLPEVEALDAGAGPHRAPLGSDAATSRGEVAARLPWNAEAEERLERIPGGFLRSLAVEQMERLALALKASEVTVLHAEAGIAEARARMRAATPDAQPAPASGCPVHQAPSPESGCPVHQASSPESDPTITPRHVLNEVTAPVVDSLGRRQVANGELVRAGDRSIP